MAIIKIEELDNEMRKRVEYLQKNNNCIILIECKNDGMYMNVLKIETGEIDTDIFLSGLNDNKYRTMIQMGKYFKIGGARMNIKDI